jgi:uncharacterized protein YeaO (DUF488 family)
MIRIKRIYDTPEQKDGFRVLVDRLWPRGLKKERAKVDMWLKEIAPDEVLRKWFSHDPAKWDEFKKRYFEELKDKKEYIDIIIERSKTDVITLLYGAKDRDHNNAVVLKEFIGKNYLIEG